MKKPLQAWFEDAGGQHYEIPLDADEPVLIGRGASFAAAGRPFIEIPEKPETLTVSRGHALLAWSETAGWSLIDNKSRTGMYVEGRKAGEGETLPLREGAAVRLGAFKITFRQRLAPLETSLVSPPSEAGPGAPPPVAQASSLQYPGRQDACATSAEAPREAPPEAPTRIMATPLAEQAAAAPPAAAPAALAHVDDGLTRPIYDLRPAEIGGLGGFEVNRFFLDAWNDGRIEAIEIPQAPGRSQWIVGRAKARAEEAGAPGEAGLVAIPNIQAFRTISRQHLLLLRQPEGGWRVRVLSAQGARVNDDPLQENEEAAVQPGDRLAMGNVVFFFRAGETHPAYTATDYNVKAAARVLLAPGSDPAVTRELPQRFFERGPAADSIPAWGYLVENIHLNARRFALFGRVSRIGSHPLNCDIQMDDPGIGDLYAVIQWSGDQVKIVSKSQENPVHVDHVPYRSSPPLRHGSVLTLGTREFLLQIIGAPPTSLGAQLHQRLRRSLIFFVVSVNLLFFGGFLGLRAIMPGPEAVKIKKPLPWDEAVADIVKHGGPAGLGALANALNGANERLLRENELAVQLGRPVKEIKREEEDIAQIRKTAVEQLRGVVQVADLVGKASPAEFQQQALEIEKKLAEGRQVFRSAYLDDSLAKEGWYAEIAKAFNARKDAAFASDWQRFLDALAANMIEQASGELGRLAAAGYRKQAVDDAGEAIAIWKRIQSRTRDAGADRLIEDYKKSCREVKSGEFLAQARERFDGAASMTADLKGRSDDAAKKLAASAPFLQADALAAGLVRILTLLEVYQAGDAKGYAEKRAALAETVKHDYLEVMGNNIAAWQSWNERYKTAGGPLGDGALTAELQRLKVAVAETVAPDSAFLIQLQGKLSEIAQGRVNEAARLRAAAEADANLYTKLAKLLDSVELDPQPKTLGEMETLAIRHLGELNVGGRDKILAEKGDLTRLYQRYKTLIARGVLPESYPPKLQIGTLMKAYNFGDTTGKQ